jgi:type IX secretion system PorP/SprF family membrane protein
MTRLFAIFLLIFINQLQAHEVHFSKFSKTKSLLNPSLIANQDNDYHIHLQRRSQWSSVTVPFNTLSLSFIVKNLYKDISLGATFLNDITGDSHFSTNGLNLSVANSFNSKDNSFSAAFFSGMYQRSIDFGGLIFLEEEDISNTNFTFFDIGVGVSNYRKIDRNSSLLVGISAYHLNTPNQSFSTSDKVSLQPKHILHSTYSKIITPKIKIAPTFYLSSQKHDRELIIGSGVSYKATNFVDLKSGLYVRMNDAIFVSFGLQKENLEVLVSYDINTSSLSNASNNMGGFEFSVNYGWSIIKEQEEIEQKICPKYL